LESKVGVTDLRKIPHVKTAKNRKTTKKHLKYMSQNIEEGAKMIEIPRDAIISCLFKNKSVVLSVDRQKWRDDLVFKNIFVRISKSPIIKLAILQFLFNFLLPKIIMENVPLEINSETSRNIT